MTYGPEDSAAQPQWILKQQTLRVMDGLVPAIHVLLRGQKDVDARDKRGHDDRWGVS
ncbi:MAG: hypothetical protein ACLPKB_23825 [Xanthobacteraceae bacterium]